MIGKIDLPNGDEANFHYSPNLFVLHEIIVTKGGGNRDIYLLPQSLKYYETMDELKQVVREMAIKGLKNF